MRSIRKLAVAASAAALPLALALAPAAMADYSTNTGTTMASAQSDGAMTQYGISRTITFTIDNTGNAAAGRPTGTVSFAVSPNLDTAFTSARSVTAQPGASSTQSTATLTFNANTPAQQSYTVTATYTPTSGSGFTGSSRAGYVTIFPRTTTTTGSVTSGPNAQFSATVAPVQGSGQSVASPNAGTVNFNVTGNATRSGTGTVSGGVATVDLADLLAGDYSLGTSYGGTTNYASSTGTAVQFSIGSGTAVAATRVHRSNSSDGYVTATLKRADGTLIPGYKLDLVVKQGATTKFSCTGAGAPTTNASGVAQCNSNSANLSQGGIYTVTVTFTAVDTTYKSSTITSDVKES